MQIELTEEEVALLLKSMDVVIEVAHRTKWPLNKVRPLINLMHRVDAQTLSRHEDRKGLK